MAQIWIHGKLVVPRDDNELLRLLPLADKDAPSESADAKVPEKKLAQGSPMAGFYEETDESVRPVLAALGKAHPQSLYAEDLKKVIPAGGRDLKGVMSTLSKRFGKRSAVEMEVERKGKERKFKYKLTQKMFAVAKQEGWAS